MLSYIARRLLLFVPMAAGMVIVTFSLLLLIPGDPAAVLLGQEASPADIAQLRATLGLDQPWYIRLGGYFAKLLQGDMGRSIFQNQTVSEIISGRLGATVELAVAALVVAVVDRRDARRRRRDAAGRLGRYGGHAAGPARRVDAGLLARHPAHARLRGQARLAALDRPRRADRDRHRLALPGGRASSSTPCPTCSCRRSPSASIPPPSSAGSCAHRWSRCCGRISCGPRMRKGCRAPAS